MSRVRVGMSEPDSATGERKAEEPFGLARQPRVGSPAGCWMDPEEAERSERRCREGTGHVLGRSGTQDVG